MQWQAVSDQCEVAGGSLARYLEKNEGNAEKEVKGKKGRANVANDSRVTLHYTLLLVPSKGLEPPHPCEYMDLNHARLPIPPRWQVDFNRRGDPKGRRIRKTCVVYSTDTSLGVKPSDLRANTIHR